MNKSNRVSHFKIGDVVKLPSESKAMTVVSVADDRVQCVWLNHELSAHYHDFEPQVLVHASSITHPTATMLDRSLMEN